MVASIRSKLVPMYCLTLVFTGAAGASSKKAPKPWGTTITRTGRREGSAAQKIY